MNYVKELLYECLQKIEKSKSKTQAKARRKRAERESNSICIQIACNS